MNPVYPGVSAAHPRAKEPKCRKETLAPQGIPAPHAPSPSTAEKAPPRRAHAARARARRDSHPRHAARAGTHARQLRPLSGASGSRGERRRVVEQPAERVPLEQAPAACARHELELGEHRARVGAPPGVAALPLVAEPAAQLVEALARVEDAAHDELRRDGAVPPVLLQAERDVVAARPPEAVELAAGAE